MTFGIILAYLSLLLFLGVFCARLLQKRSSGDFFLANRGIGPFMLLMSVFGTTMTSFALVGSTGRAFSRGIGVYGLMASWSGIIHAAIFFLVGAKVWSLGKKHGYVTQLSYFRDRYQSNGLALLLFPIMVCFVMLYILMGVVGSGKFLQNITGETWAKADARTTVTLAAIPDDLSIPEAWKDRFQIDETAGTVTFSGSAANGRKGLFTKWSADPSWKQAAVQLVTEAPKGSLPPAAGMAIICLVVLFYVFFGGMRATAWANTLQTIVFMVMGVIAFWVITDKLGGPKAATEALLTHEHGAQRMAREGLIGKLEFLSYCFIPLSVGMFPHLFQHWLTAKRASNFKLTVVAHPLCILVTWIPCVLLGMWAAGILPTTTKENAVLGMMVARNAGNVLTGLIGAGVLAAIMSSMDSQFLCLSSLFTNDIVAHYRRKKPVSERGRVLLGRGFVLMIVAIAYVIGLYAPASVFKMGVWCFTGFAGLTPVLFASLYWKRSNRQGAIASVLTVAVLWLTMLRPAVYGEGDHEFLLFHLMPVTVVVAAATLVLVVVTKMTPPPPRETVEKFFGSDAMRTA